MQNYISQPVLTPMYAPSKPISVQLDGLPGQRKLRRLSQDYSSQRSSEASVGPNRRTRTDRDQLRTDWRHTFQ